MSKIFERFPQETLADIDNLIENIFKKTDAEKGESIHKFIECLINLHNDVGKETELHSVHRKCESIRKAGWQRLGRCGRDYGQIKTS